MHANIEHLVKLQTVELERSRLAQLAKALPALKSTRPSPHWRQCRQRRPPPPTRLNREDSLRTRLEREIAGHRQKAARYKAQQDSVTTPAQAAAIEHEVQFAQAEIDRLENEEFASLERSETQEETLATARAQVEELAATLEKTQGAVAASRRIWPDSRPRLWQSARRCALKFAAELLTRFDRIASQRGTGIARVENQQCMGCRMGVRPQMWNQLREGELLTCDSCGRLLYWDPAMTPAPKTPQPEPAAETGRAVRKPRHAGA